MEKTRYNKMISVKVTNKQAELLKKIADLKQISQGGVIRQWIEKEYSQIKTKS